ncbi:uncharacterized protein LOC143354612 [Halictus rubicundus]|uniref:uncharacterized protein LOC143354612 n=1 Tax=Halictus rubicundus TaxID=77578 RepID=UPI004036DA0F
MEARTWTVVQFVADGSVEAVPTDWIQRNNCYWPPLQQSRVAKAVKQLEPRGESWSQHEVKIFRNGTFDNYMTARRKSKAAEDTSDLQSEVELWLHKRKKIKFSSSEDSDEETILFSPPGRKTQKKMGM